jgi:hypothetical protein
LLSGNPLNVLAIRQGVEYFQIQRE